MNNRPTSGHGPLLALGLICHALLANTCALADQPATEPSIAQIVKQIEEMPDWPLLPAVKGKTEDHKAMQEALDIEDCAMQIARCDSKTLREAFRTYQAKTTDPRDRMKVHILAKYLFEIPETIDDDSPHLRYLTPSWAALPEKEGRIFARWPWHAEESGRWRFVVDKRIFVYMGPPPDCLRKFDYLENHFPRRKISTE